MPEPGVLASSDFTRSPAFAFVLGFAVACTGAMLLSGSLTPSCGSSLAPLSVGSNVVVAPASPAAAAARPVPSPAPASVPPLIIVTSDREFCLAAAAGAVSDEGARPTTAADAAAEPVAGLDAAFGGAGPRPIAQAPISGLKAGRGPAWGALFDAPSHALAPPAALAPRFLECLLLGKD